MTPLQRGGLRARLAGLQDRPRLLALRQAAFPRVDGTPEGWEALDDACRHVLVETAGGQALAAFRVLELADGRALAGSYSARFHDLSPLMADPRPLAEMGRFCLVSGPQAADALRLAWGAMTRLVDAAGAARLIGCTSFPGAGWPRHRAALALLAERHLGPPALRPRAGSGEVVRYPALCGPVGDRRAALAGLPPLLRSYLAMGGWVGDHAVADRQLDTLHVFTCVEVAAVPPARAQSLRAIAAGPGAPS
jgi:putative hemolysin